MDFVEFLKLILTTQARVTTELSDLVGEETLWASLEKAGDQLEDQDFNTKTNFEVAASIANAPRAHAELRDWVQGLGLSHWLEFYLWSYPLYRAYVEAEVSPGDKIIFESADDVVREAQEFAMAWFQLLDLPKQELLKAQGIVESQWIRFRTELFALLGNQRISAVPSTGAETNTISS